MENKDNSGQLFDHVIERFGLKNDAALARFLQVAPPVISKIRHGKLPVGPTLILHLAEHNDMSISTIRELILAK